MGKYTETDIDKFMEDNKDLMEDLKKLEDLEKVQETDRAEGTDLHTIAARVKNLARDWDAQLTPAGESLCNAYVWVLKDIYDFADTLEESKKSVLKELLRKHENMPRKVIEQFRPKKK
jgi:hypothetical protein